MNNDLDRFPIGVPGNRPAPPSPLVPIPGRPNWFAPRRGGDPVYREPERKTTTP